LILLDATALVAFLSAEPAASEVESLLRGGEAAIAAPNLAEVIDMLVRVRGNDLGPVEATLVPLLATALPTVPVGEFEARAAAAIRLRHYHRQRSPLSLADCLLLGTASVAGSAIATSDEPIARAARVEGVQLIGLKDSNGRRP
jgi:predicted nucleic acid-binding protein